MQNMSYITLFNEWDYNATCFSSQGVIIKQFIENLYKDVELVCKRFCMNCLMTIPWEQKHVAL
jgi:hypothetical protein